MVNIYIGLSKNHILSYESIIKRDIPKSDINILLTSSTLRVDKKLWNNIFYSKESFNNQSTNLYSSLKGIYNKIKQYKKIISELQQYKREKEVTLYFTYVEDIITNYLLLSFNKKLRGVVVEDGTLNYYHHTIKSLSKNKVFFKWLLSNVFGIRFKFYKGHSSGIEYKHVLKQYVRLPKLTLFPKKSEQLFYPNKIILLSNTVLIVGQEAYINAYGQETYMKILEELINILKKQPYYAEIEKIYYKPHRNGERINYQEIKGMFSEKQVEILEECIPLEDLYFERLGSKYIYSFDSSSLLNIYLEADNEIKKDINFNMLLRYNKLIEPIFKKFKFNIYK